MVCEMLSRLPKAVQPKHGSHIGKERQKKPISRQVQQPHSCEFIKVTRLSLHGAQVLHAHALCEGVVPGFIVLSCRENWCGHEGREVGQTVGGQRVQKNTVIVTQDGGGGGGL